MNLPFASALFLLFLLPAATASWQVHRRRMKSGIVFSLASRTPTVRTWRLRLDAIMPALFCLGLILTTLALARPQRVFSVHRSTTDAVAIAMVVDISQSMEALDMSEQTAMGVKERTRLDAAKAAFEEFINERPHDLISLVTFAGYASTRVPLTLDQGILTHSLRAVETARPVLNANGQPVDRDEYLTAVGDAIVTACARLEKTEPKSRIIVLLSDGASNTGLMQPREAAEIALKLGIRIYSIGIGSQGRAPFRVTYRDGSTGIEWGDVATDPATMKAIAERTGGKFFDVNDNDGLKAALASIDTLEKTTIDEEIYSQFDEFFPWLLWPALGLITLASATRISFGRRPL